MVVVYSPRTSIVRRTPLLMQAGCCDTIYTGKLSELLSDMLERYCIME